MIIGRSLHFTDELIENGLVRRKIGSHENYRLPSGIWASVNPELRRSDGRIPNHWSGQYDFENDAQDNCLQAFFGDATDQNNTAMVGVRSSEHPELWVNMKAVGSNRVSVEKGDRYAKWTELWDATDLEYTSLPGELNKRIILKSTGHPDQFRFSFRCAASMSWEVRNNRIFFYDSDDHEVLKTTPPIAYDSQEASIPITLTEGETIQIGNRQYPTVVLTPSIPEGASYPITLDPTIVIGDPNIVDAAVLISGPTLNYGATVQVGVRAGASARTGLIKITSFGVVPLTASNFTMWLTQYIAPPGNTVNVYLIVAANRWVEGTQSGAYEVGSCDWNSAQETLITWAGGANGCTVSGTDYTADATPPNYTDSALINTVFSCRLKDSWLQGWYNSSIYNNGLCLLTADTNTHQFRSRNDLTPARRPYFTYDIPGGKGFRFGFSYI